jgi:hypothetical protein
MTNADTKDVSRRHFFASGGKFSEMKSLGKNSLCEKRLLYVVTLPIDMAEDSLRLLNETDAT